MEILLAFLWLGWFVLMLWKFGWTIFAAVRFIAFKDRSYRADAWSGAAVMFFFLAVIEFVDWLSPFLEAK